MSKKHPITKYIIPSLGINVTNKCNLRCIYCPPYGENLKKCKLLCDIESILELLEIAKNHNISVVRLTGGEPLLEPKRTMLILKKSIILNFQKIILNTNGIFLNNNLDWLKEFNKNFLLKISLDTLNINTFEKITRRSGNLHKLIIEGIKKAKLAGLKIEINTVINKYNKNEIKDIIKFTNNLGVNIKIFDIFDFGGIVDLNESYTSISNIIEWLKKKYKYNGTERLPGGRGIAMLKFNMSCGNYALVVDHNGPYSSTKYYCDICLNCKYYPCSVGRFQIPIRSDGLLQGCRLRPENGIMISGKTKDFILKYFKNILSEFHNCFEL